MSDGTVIDPRALIGAYSRGIFPMAEDGQIYWYDPDPRAIIPLDRFHVPRRLRQTIKRNPYEIHLNRNFAAVIEGCARPGPERESTWIDTTIRDSYLLLHQIGFAHSVEAWLDGRLVGGLYGVALHGLFAGESMFSECRDASKICLVALVRGLRAGGFTLLDTQFLTPHLARFGAIEISRSAYQARLQHALQVDAQLTTLT